MKTGDAITRRAFATLLAAPFCCALGHSQLSQALFGQMAAATLERIFSDPRISWLLLDGSGGILAERWSGGRVAVPAGSLMKPFLALAWGSQHEGAYPRIDCAGARSRCWLPAGHGTLEVEDALAQSCNGYFLALAAGLDRSGAQQTLSGYGVRVPDEGSPYEALTGLGSDWREAPITLVRAYRMLASQDGPSWRGRILAGMLASADRGTARAVDAVLGRHAALAKTGTAPCTHSPQGAADGFTLAMYPSDQPRLILLVRVHGATGAESAATAGAMLRALGAGLR